MTTPVPHNARQARLALLLLFMATSIFIVEGQHVRALDDGDDDGHDGSDTGSSGHEGSDASSNGSKSHNIFDNTAVVIVVGVVAVVLAVAGAMLVVARRRRNRALERNSSATSPRANELSPAPLVGVAYARH
ncbi:unnamed protein product [Phytophthora fragariaefolia]|uniref:Unnamed protein product n=1 Tax=Phytophthora fragariaefolia TaxID=1490495 RepID=A0A9W6U5V0_9STRA|nr:unnamed protein product [Phytophthora fragariaefolia]